MCFYLLATIPIMQKLSKFERMRGIATIAFL